MSDVKRVLMTADTVGGVWTFAIELAGALEPHGIQVIMAALGGEPSPEQCAEAESIPNLRLLTSSYKLEWMTEPWADVEASGKWLLDLERQFTPDLIHLNSFGHGALYWEHPVILTAHSCVLSWWTAVRRTVLPREWDRYRDEVRRSLRSATIVTAPSRGMLLTLLSNYSLDISCCRVVLNGRNPHRFWRAEKEAIVLAAGRLWDEAKNLRVLVDIAASLPWPVYLAGEEQGPNGEITSTPGCKALGQLGAAALAEWYARASIFVAPARYEPFGLSILEAALSGCALVLGDIETLREIWGDVAVFVPPGDREHLAAALRSLTSHPAERETLAARSTSRAMELTASRMAAEYAEVYRQATEGRAACAS